MIRALPVLSRIIARPGITVLALYILVKMAQPAFAAPAVAADANLYVEYLSMKAGGSVCNERIPGFSYKFKPWFASWQEKRADRLGRGPLALEQTQRQHGIDYEQLVAKVAQKLREADATVLNRECSTLLEVVEPYIAQ